ncbi:MAG: FIST C-terminal domain-containing protein [Chloroflexi bacterium]|nr:FIST C-terminal domain-containing protein [Chloroflexota bacterium]
MKIDQRKWTGSAGWEPASPGPISGSAQLALVFGATSLLKDPKHVEAIRQTYPAAHVLGCTTAGEILGTQVTDETIVTTAVHFEHTTFQGAEIRLSEVKDDFEAGQRLAAALSKEKLVHVFVISDGQKVNGSELVRGLTSGLPSGVAVTGGLAGDGPRFGQTLVFLDSTPEPEKIAVLGFYGDRLKIGYGSKGGWDPFGPERLVTRSKGNVLYELDGQSALALYKKYLGDYAKDLPASGLLFPLNVRVKEGDNGVVRTILGVSEEDQSMTFAGDVPEGSFARLMKANFERLVDGATGAAQTSYEAIGSTPPDLAILISCVGRKLVLKQRVEEEVESVLETLGGKTAITGFYSYGEICPAAPYADCELHNQTMTITTLSER